jgi:SAM-dependent methyltransferase
MAPRWTSLPVGAKVRAVPALPPHPRVQRAYYRAADSAHFTWQTETPYFAAKEAELVAEVQVEAGESLLEIGCGEGGNLFHLRDRPGRRYGVDFSLAKAAFARGATQAGIACADASALPFADASFDAVLIRDLLHHLPDRGIALAEAHRVLKPGGRLTLVEPNAYSPLVLLQACTVQAERGLFRSTARRLRRELGRAGFRLERATRAQPLPIGRVVLHPKMGIPALSARRWVTGALDRIDHLARRALPERVWLYLIFSAVRA